MRQIGTRVTATVAKEVTVSFDDVDDDDFWDGIGYLLGKINAELRVRREMAGEYAMVYHNTMAGCVGVDITDPANTLANLVEAVQVLIPNLRNLSLDMHTPDEEGMVMLTAMWSYEDKKFKEG